MSIVATGSMRALLRSWMPWFAQGGRAGLIVDPLGSGADRVLQASIEAVRIRCPSVCPPDALPLIGRDRRIPRAPGEPLDSYRRRLLLWLDLWALAGLPLGLLYAIQSFMYPGYPMVRIVTRGGYWWTLDEGASATMTTYEAATLACTPEPGFATSESRYFPAIDASPRAAFWTHVESPSNWDYDSNSNPERAASWWDFWIIVYPTSYGFQDVYDGPVDYDSDTCWGLDVSPGTVETMRQLARTYKRAGSECRGVLFAPSVADFDPFALISDPGMPDGWWGQDVRLIAGVWTATRRADVRYVEV